VGTFAPGDTVSCKVGYDKIAHALSDEFEIIHNFDIVCSCDEGYLIYVPRDLFLLNSFELTAKDCKTFKIPLKFKDCKVHFISEGHIVSLVCKLTGLSCNKCNEYYPFASPNSINIFICWSCRNYPFYK